MISQGKDKCLAIWQTEVQVGALGCQMKTWLSYFKLFPESVEATWDIGYLRTEAK